jgi:hypothetical protein
MNWDSYELQGIIGGFDDSILIDKPEPLIIDNNGSRGLI